MPKFDIRDIMESPTCSVLEIIQNLNRSRRGIVLICDENRKLIGTVTDADIRFGLAKGIELSDTVSLIMKNTPKTVDQKVPSEELADLFQETQLRAIPVIDHNGHLLDCAFIDSFSKIHMRSKTALIMAGGFGKRMGSLTQTTPKPMLEIRGRPMIEHVVESAVIDGFERIYISTHYLPEKISECLGDGARLGAKISYLREERPLGTIGSFRNLPVNSGPVLVTNADVMSNVGYAKLLDFHLLNKGNVTLAVRDHIIQHPFGVVNSEGIEFVSMEEKPKWTTSINAGIYIFEAETKFLINKNEALSTPELILRAKKMKKRVLTFPLHEDWIDLGSQTDYFKFRDLKH